MAQGGRGKELPFQGSGGGERGNFLWDPISAGKHVEEGDFSLPHSQTLGSSTTPDSKACEQAVRVRSLPIHTGSPLAKPRQA